jgi:hypothetical protein
MKRGRVLVVVAMVAAATPIITLLDGSAAHAAGNTRKVSTSGTDTGNCKFAPCATVNYALSQSLPYDTITVAAGTYNQTVDIEKPITLTGAGASTTTIDGTGLDPSTSGNNPYGVIYVGTTGGSVAISGFTITNPAPFAFTSGEPILVALRDTKSTDAVSISKDILTEGTSDSNTLTDFPIGVDAFHNAAQTTIVNNTISGVFQGGLFQDNGPLAFNSNTITQLISGTDNTTSPPTIYPAEGGLIVADQAGPFTLQRAQLNTLSNYGGFGLILDDNFTCNTPPCNSLSGSLVNNNLTLSPGVAGTFGLMFVSQNPGDALGAVSKGNHGTVAAPTIPELVLATSGGSVDVQDFGNNITTGGSATAKNPAPLHLPKLS